MLAFALAIGIFAYWSLLGFSLVSVLNSQKNLLRNALFSPVVGVAATLLCVVWLNVVGFPLKRVSLALTIVLLLGAILLIVRSRPVLPIKRLVPFIVVLMLGALLTGYPLLRFGFDWVSFSNDDMANYSLGAHFLSNYSFFPLPPAERLVEDRDASAYIWYYIVGGGERPGLEFIAAWATSLTSLSGHQIYMPTILALHLVLLSATSALLLQGRQYRSIALLTCIWMACSALTALGTLYQLMGQVLGLAILIGACVMLCTEYGPAPRRMHLGRIALSAILLASLIIVYPELLPFFCLTFFLYHAALLIRKQEAWKPLLQVTGLVAVTSILLVNVLLVGIMTDVVSRLLGTSVTTPPEKMLFPFYLLPSGLAHLWGFYPIGKIIMTTPYLNLSIAAGALLLLVTCVGALWHAWRGRAIAIMCVIIMALGVRCFIVKADFPLYKLAMYIQPFLLGTVVLSWFQIIAHGQNTWLPARLKKPALLGPLAVVIAAGLTGQMYYTQRSLGSVGGGFVEIPRASESRLISQLIAMSRQAPPQAVISDTHNVALAKFQSAYTTPAPVFFIAEDFVGRFVQPQIRHRAAEMFLSWMQPNLPAQLRYVFEERIKRFREVDFDTHGAHASKNRFRVRLETRDSELPHATLWQSLDQSILNRRSIPPARGGSILRTLDLAQARDQLFFVASEFGTAYYTHPGNRSAGRIAMYQPENDYYYPHNTVVAMGRATLLRIFNPSPQSRLVLEYTASLNGDHDNRIPPISVIGAERQFLAVEGRGSARLFSPVIQPQSIEGGSYFLLDMGTWGFRFPNRLTGLMTLYGRGVSLDNRRLTGFGRDLSALAEQEYESLMAPEHVQSFPDDLADQNLEYSGIYEDGWVAESSSLVLRQAAEESVLVVRAMVPMLEGEPASSQLILLVDGSEVGRKSLGRGDFQFKVPTAGVGKHRIKLVFDRATHLPAPDNRPVSALIRFVGFRSH